MSSLNTVKQSQYDNVGGQRAIQPEPLMTGEVHDQLNQMQYALNAQQDIIQALLKRLEPITGCLEYPVGESGGVKMSSLVPIAARIQQQVERVQSVNSDLDRILSHMQI